MVRPVPALSEEIPRSLLVGQADEFNLPASLLKLFDTWKRSVLSLVARLKSSLFLAALHILTINYL